MKLGHIIALIGAGLAAAGAALPEYWQAFTLAEIKASGLETPPAGQAVLVLAGLAILTSLFGLLTRRRKQAATATLVLGIFSIGWVILANVTKSSAFFPEGHEYYQYETVEMLGGYTLAVCGSFLMFFGSLGVLAVEPGLDPNKDYLRLALLWNGTVIEEQVLQDPDTFTIGENRKNDFVVPESALPSVFPLFKIDRKLNYSIGLADGLDGDITINQQTESLASFRAKATSNSNGVGYVPIAKDDWGVLQLNEVQVFFQFIRPDERLKKKGFFAVDEYVASTLALSLAVQMLLIFFAVVTWDENFERELVVNPKKPMVAKANHNMEKKKEKKELEKEKEDDSESKRAPDEEGKFGDPDKDKKKKTKLPKKDGKMKKKVDPKKVGLNDLLSTNKLGGVGAIANIMSSSNSGFGNKLAVAFAGEGDELEIGFGSGGMGLSGDGLGGGGDGGAGRIGGTGDFDTGGGHGHGGMGGRSRKRTAKLKLSSGSAKGFCKASDIKSKVKRRAGAIRACYERALMRNPKLAGKVSARWTIGMDGRVMGAVSASGLGPVGKCIAQKLQNVRFKPPEGGVCVIRWPFVFSSGE
jgi:hypothetical protein